MHNKPMEAGINAHMAPYAILFYMLVGTTHANVTLEQTHVVPSQENDTCEVSVWRNSVDYFKSRLEESEPNFIHFFIKFNMSVNKWYNSTQDTFRPLHWVWTYQSPKGIYPYVFWNLDYGLLSFGLLDSRTLPNEMYMQVNVSNGCDLTFGTNTTVHHLMHAFLEVTKAAIAGKHGHAIKYQDSLYCYMVINRGIKGTLTYKAAIYFLLPIDYIKYKCCQTRHDYSKDKFLFKCGDSGLEKWPQTTILPYILGLVMFMYFPIALVKYSASVATGLSVIPAERELTRVNTPNHPENGDGLQQPLVESAVEIDGDWVYVDGHSPKTLFGLSECIWCGLQESYPVLVSRIKRAMFLFYGPSFVLVELHVYDIYMKPEMMKELIQIGTPMGFLSLLGDKNNRMQSFAPALGGAFCLLIAYFILGILFIVCPYKLKQIVEDGLPMNSHRERSPLCFGANKIKLLSMVPRKIETAYGECNTIFICSIYMLFSHRFWKELYAIQKKRYMSLRRFPLCRGAAGLVLGIFLFVLYVPLCILEIVLCIIWYGQPLFRYLSIMVKGYTVSLLDLQRYGRRQANVITKFFMNPIVFGFGGMIIFLTHVYFCYAMCMLFIQIFLFLSNVIVFCFVAVIVYPDSAFGYLFFCIAIFYYMIHMVRNFGDTYLNLLVDAVEVVEALDNERCTTTLVDETLIISNIEFGRLKTITINNTVVDITQNVLDKVASHRTRELKVNSGFCGIRRDLFDELVRRYRPVHREILKLIIKLILIIFLLTVTISLTTGSRTGPASEISEVMHVIFTVVVGALPRMLEIVLSIGSDSTKREIERRQMRRTVLVYRLQNALQE